MKTYKGGIHWSTAGDSHGDCLIGIIYGLTSGWSIDVEVALSLIHISEPKRLRRI